MPILPILPSCPSCPPSSYAPLLGQPKVDWCVRQDNRLDVETCLLCLCHFPVHPDIDEFYPFSQGSRNRDTGQVLGLTIINGYIYKVLLIRLLRRKKTSQSAF